MICPAKSDLKQVMGVFPFAYLKSPGNRNSLILLGRLKLSRKTAMISILKITPLARMLNESSACRAGQLFLAHVIQQSTHSSGQSILRPNIRLRNHLQHSQSKTSSESVPYYFTASMESGKTCFEAIISHLKNQWQFLLVL